MLIIETHRGNTEMKIMRHHYRTSTGVNFFLKGQAERGMFERQNKGWSYHGFVDVPNECRPLVLRG